MNKTEQQSETRNQILRAALRHFARRGYAATSVQQIVSTARVSKPALYYYFGDKAALFQALVDHAHDERYRLMLAAAEKGGSFAQKLEEIITAIFDFSLHNQELMRLAFATAFAGSEGAPGREKCKEKGLRNFNFLRSVIQEGQALGELSADFELDDLAMAIFGQVNSYIMVRLLMPDCPLNRETAQAIVRLFMQGASPRPGKKGNANGTGHKPRSAKTRVTLN